MKLDTSNMELTEKVVTIKRVTKVVKGGRTMRFSALVVVGDGNGHVGAGIGKSSEIPEAIRKGKEDAIKNMVSIALDENNEICGYQYLSLGKFTDFLKKGLSPEEALEKALKGNIEPNVFMERSTTGKPFADLSAALVRANKLMGQLAKIPVISPDQVPHESILNEFIGENQ